MCSVTGDQGDVDGCGGDGSKVFKESGTRGEIVKPLVVSGFYC